VKLFKSPLRRTTAVLAGAVLGLAGAVALAAPASAHHPLVSPVSSCVNEKDGSWKVVWKVVNSEKDLAGVVTDVKAQPADKSTITGFTADTALPKAGAGEVTFTQELTAEARGAHVVVKAKWIRDGKEIKERGEGHLPKPTEVCKPTTPEEPEPEPSTPAEPTPIKKADCDSLTLGLKNPADGEDITLVFKTSKGETRELEVPAGSEKTTKFSADEGFSVEVSAKGLEGSTKVEYEQPEGCAGQGAGEPELPVTGAAVGGIAGGAGLLLAVGGVLFFMARRRKVKFTA
jgi:LPXTG-motif cell wall-anchored protein